MNRRLVIRAEAARDIAGAYDWYESTLPGLGGQFLDAVESGMSTVTAFPEASPLVHGRVRRCLLRRFPYGVFYILTDDTISVVSVFHIRRDPQDQGGASA